MPILAGQLVQGQKLVSVTQEESLPRALAMMIEHDFSQLPVVDQENKPLGIVTCASIARALLHLGAKIEELRVNHALVKLPTYPVDEDLLYLLDTLLKASAVFVVDATNKLVGIITEYDTTQYFRQRAEDLVLINDIEDALKRHLQVAYDAQDQESPALRDAIDNLNNSLDGIRKKSHASLKALCKSKDIKPSTGELEGIVDKHFPVREAPQAFIDLSLSELIQLAQKNWIKLEPTFNIAQPAWSKMMDEVRQIRNKLFHFKGDTTAVERSRLQFCSSWYTNHPPSSPHQAKTVTPSDNPIDPNSSEQPGLPQNPDSPDKDGPNSAKRIITDTSDASISQSASKYKPIIDVLKQNEDVAVGTLVQVNVEYLNGAIIGGLPKAAREHLSWWTNPSAHSEEWLIRGWKPISIDPRWVSFRRMPNPGENSQINLDEPYEVAYWCKELNCTAEQLKAAVQVIGTTPSTIKSYLMTTKNLFT